jgi:hypothetical protein
LAALLAQVACSSTSTSPADAGGGTTTDAGGSADSSSVDSSLPPADSAVDSALPDVVGTSDGGDTWDSWAQGFFATYCVPCHAANDSTGRDFRSKSIVVSQRLEIRCGVAAVQDPSWACAAFPPPRQFPIGTGPKPSDAERARAVAWITAGCP